MRHGATFVNTARGNIIHEMELIEVLRRRLIFKLSWM